MRLTGVLEALCLTPTLLRGSPSSQLGPLIAGQFASYIGGLSIAEVALVGETYFATYTDRMTETDTTIVVHSPLARFSGQCHLRKPG